MLRARLLLLVALALPLAGAQEPRAWPDGAYNWFEHSPIRIHVDATNLTEETMGYLASVRAALRYWEWGGNGRLQWEARFEEVATREEADIVLWFAGDPEEAMCAGNPDSLGCARPFARPVPIEILTRGGDGKPTSYQRVREVTQHEVGHAIGFPHSDLAGDVMAPHASRRAAGTYSPGDWRQIVAGVAFLVLFVAGLAYVLHRMLTPIRDVHLLPQGPASPCRRFRRHAFAPLDVDADGHWVSLMVCRRCHGGYPIEAGAEPLA